MAQPEGEPHPPMPSGQQAHEEPSPSEQAAGEPARPPARRPLLQHPLLYVVLLVLYAASFFGGWVPLPRLPSEKRPTHIWYPRTFDEVMQEPRDMPPGRAFLTLGPLLIGSAMFLGYLVLRACNVRVFPRCEFPMVPWDGWYLARCGVVYLMVERVVWAGAAWLQQLQRTHPAWASPSSGVVLMAGINVIMIATCAFVAALVGSGGQDPFRLLGLREKRVLNRAAIGVAGMVMIIPVLFVVFVLMSVYGPLLGIRPRLQEPLASIGRMTPLAMCFLVTGIAVVAPVTEEILFRGFLYATLRRYLGPLEAICLSAAGFALLHGYAFGFLYLFVVGFLVSYLYERTGSLVASIAAHAANNLYSLLLFFAFPSGSL